MGDCIFCKIVRKELPSLRVYKDEIVYAFLDIKPTNPGHTQIIPIAHYTNAFETPDETLTHMLTIAKKLAPAIKKAVNADGINLIINSDPAAGQLVFHTHLHIVPRFQNDGFRQWPGRTPNPGEREAVAEKIKAVLS